MEQTIETRRKELGHRLELQPIAGVKSANGMNNKAKDHGLRRKIKLKKLSLFYAGERDLSFDEEDDRDVSENPEHILVSKSQYRLQRLSDLTNKINQWDEDNKYNKQEISFAGSKTKNRKLKLSPENQEGGDSIISDRDRDQILEDDERNYYCIKDVAEHDDTKSLFSSLRNTEGDICHLPEKVTNNPIKCLRKASIDKLMRECENLKESSDYSSADEDDRTKVYFSPAKLIKSSSFEYIRNELQTPLLYTVSFYRKQQQQRQVVSKEEKEDTKNNEDSGSSLEEKVQKLLAEVDRQGVIRTQASQALHWCISNAKFYGGEEQVEGERLLLLADHKRQACLNEIKRLKSENGCEPGEMNLISKRDFITVSGISIKLRKDTFQSMADRPLHFVCLLKSGDCVLATPPVSTTRINLLDFSLLFPGSLNLETSFSDPTITIEIYCLNLNEKFFVDNFKYEKKENKFLSPAKRNKFEMGWPDRNILGSYIARTTNFSISGSLTFALKETNQTHWNLDPLPPKSPLEGTVSMCIRSHMCFDTEFRAFLTVFDDVSGFGVWHRRWCLLSSHYMLFWKYPDDEQSKAVPVGMIDLRTVVTEKVGRVPFDVCARPNTFHLESARPFLKEDKNSLILRIEEDVTTIRYLLSADSKSEMLSWCRRLNAVLDLLRKDAGYTIYHT